MTSDHRPTTRTVSKDSFRARSERLVLRPFEASDYESWLAGVGGRLKKQSEFDPGRLPAQRMKQYAFRAWVSGLRQAWVIDRVYMLGIFSASNGDSIGMVNFSVIARLQYQFANLGYEINNQCWGNGYAAEAVRCAIPLALKKLKVHRIEAGIEPHNKPSLKVAEKAGMSYEGLREKYYFNGKQWIDLVYYRSIAEEHGISRVKPSIGKTLADLL